MTLSLVYLGEQITIYGGCFIFILGIIGNAINIFIFSCVRTYRTTPCTFYFLIGSISNALYLLINLSTRILAVGYGIDLTDISIFLCKTRLFLTLYLFILSATCPCLATIDQFFCTSRSASLRRCSQIKWTYRLVVIVIILNCLHGIPIFIFLDLSPPMRSCMITNLMYFTYIPVTIIVLGFVVSTLIIIIFGCLAYRNIRQTVVLIRNSTGRQITQMTLFQVLLVVISYCPFGITSIYVLMTSKVPKDLTRQLQEDFVITVFTLLSYFYYFGNFYVFLFASSRFRRTVKERILCRCRSNQIDPVQ